MTRAELRELAQQLMDDYAERIDDDRLEEWIDLFAEDGRYRVLPRENYDLDLPACLILCTNKDMIRDRIVSLRQANEYNLHHDRHLVSNVRVKPRAEGDWQLDANYAVFQTDLDGHSRLFSVGRYRHGVRLQGDALQLVDALVIVDSFAVPTLLATPL
jgi:anthranilate 1,2-dioxygenase small subunit